MAGRGEVLCWTVSCAVGGKVGCGNRSGMGGWEGKGGRWKGRKPVESSQ